MSEEIVLSCSNLQKSYKQGKFCLDVLNGIDLNVPRGENIAIVGASGSGKSTLLHLLGGLDDATAGEVFMGGKNLLTLQETERNKLRNHCLGFVYQFHHLLSEFTAIENVAMPLLIANRQTNGEISARAGEVLQGVGLGKRLQHKPAELSGGERQRVALARALVNQPECILMDEPTGNLDEKTAEQMLDLILQLSRATGVTLVMVTHNLSLAEQMDKIYQLHEGNLRRYEVI